jgi:tetratricopeptide (TPR) repeat protein
MDAGAGPVPRLIPAPARMIVGRDAELAAAAAYLNGSEAFPRVLVIHGPVGIGKTTFVRALAARVAGSFPGGQVVASSPAQPVNPAAATTQAAESATLLLVEDVDGRDQLDRMIPRVGKWAVIATSREPLSTPADYAHQFGLGPLDESSALHVLRESLGDAYLEETPSATRQVVELLEGQPYALRATIDGLTLAPHLSLADAVGRLGDSRPRDRDTHPLDLAYALLTADEKDSFALLSLLPEPAPLWTIATLLSAPELGRGEVDEPAAADSANALFRAGLVDRRSTDPVGLPVFDLQPWARAFASARLDERISVDRTVLLDQLESRQRRRLAVANATPGLNEIVFQPLAEGRIDDALDAARQAATIAHQRSDRVAEGFAIAALAQVRLELGNLAAASELARSAMSTAGSDPRVQASALRCLGTVSLRLRSSPDAERDLGLALQLSQGRPEEEVLALRELAVVQARDPRLRRQAELTLSRAQRQCEKPGAQWLEPRLRWSESVVWESLGRVDEGLRAARRGLEAAGDQRLWVAWLKVREADLSLQVGDPETAGRVASDAINEFAAINHHYGRSSCHLVMGRVRLAQGQPGPARADFEEALEGFVSCGDRWSEAEAFRLLADVYPADEYRLRLAFARTAGAIFSDLGDVDAHTAVERQSRELRRMRPHGSDALTLPDGAE